MRWSHLSVSFVACLNKLKLTYFSLRLCLNSTRLIFRQHEFGTWVDVSVLWKNFVIPTDCWLDWVKSRTGDNHWFRNGFWLLFWIGKSLVFGHRESTVGSVHDGLWVGVVISGSRVAVLLNERWVFDILPSCGKGETFILFIGLFGIVLEIIQKCGIVGSRRRSVRLNPENRALFTNTEAWGFFAVGWWYVVKVVWLLCYEGFRLDVTAWIKPFGLAETELKFRCWVVHGVEQDLLRCRCVVKRGFHRFVILLIYYKSL